MKKEVIILVYYVNTGNLDTEETNEFLSSTHEMFESIEWTDEVFVKVFLIPVRDQRSHLDCIYPVNMNDMDTNKVFQSLSSASEQLTNFLKNATNTLDIKNKS